MRNAGLSIKSLVEYVKLSNDGEKTIEARKKILTSQRGCLVSKIEEMKKRLEILDYKIKKYKTIQFANIEHESKVD
jgi:DNA-binding transcriptional MerR regulator